MPGPPPKPASQRRRRNKPAVAATLSAAPRRRRAPALPGADRMLEETRTWWKTVWASPMAAHWIEADRPAVVRLAHLQDLVARELRGWSDRPGPAVGDLVESENEPGLVRVRLAGAMVSVALLAEMRQIEDRLGLTPMARRRLQWEIDDAPAPAAAAPPDQLAARRERFARLA